MKPLFRNYSFFLPVLLLAGCATVPYTGRRQLALVSDREILELGRTSYRQALSEATVSRGSEAAALVEKVGHRIAAASEDFLRDEGNGAEVKNFSWEFNLIEDDEQANAWCMPGGKIAVYSGILPYTRDEAGLAVVMGHEVAHALARHGKERMSHALLVQLGGLGLSQALREEPETTQILWYAAYGLGAQVGYMLPYSRLHEYEADRIGLILTARAGYDPREAVSFWERMLASGKGHPPEFLSTHPADGDRIRALKEMMPEALSYWRP